eukprot:COSAG01_NODE_9552_length_2411_cov_362.384948_1_plen_678_part_01
MAAPWHDGIPLLPRYGYPGTMGAADDEESVPSGLRVIDPMRRYAQRPGAEQFGAVVTSSRAAVPPPLGSTVGERQNLLPSQSAGPPGMLLPLQPKPEGASGGAFPSPLTWEEWYQLGIKEGADYKAAIIALDSTMRSRLAQGVSDSGDDVFVEKVVAIASAHEHGGVVMPPQTTGLFRRCGPLSRKLSVRKSGVVRGGGGRSEQVTPIGGGGSGSGDDDSSGGEDDGSGSDDNHAHGNDRRLPCYCHGYRCGWLPRKVLQLLLLIVSAAVIIVSVVVQMVDVLLIHLFIYRGFRFAKDDKFDKDKLDAGKQQEEAGWHCADEYCSWLTDWDAVALRGRLSAIPQRFLLEKEFYNLGTLYIFAFRAFRFDMGTTRLLVVDENAGQKRKKSCWDTLDQKCVSCACCIGIACCPCKAASRNTTTLWKFWRGQIPAPRAPRKWRRGRVVTFTLASGSTITDAMGAGNPLRQGIGTGAAVGVLMTDVAAGASTFDVRVTSKAAFKNASGAAKVEFTAFPANDLAVVDQDGKNTSVGRRRKCRPEKDFPSKIVAFAIILAGKIVAKAIILAGKIVAKIVAVARGGVSKPSQLRLELVDAGGATRYRTSGGALRDSLPNTEDVIRVAHGAESGDQPMAVPETFVASYFVYHDRVSRAVYEHRLLHTPADNRDGFFVELRRRAKIK